MIKVEHRLDESRKLVMFAFQASSAEDFPALDLLRAALENRPDVRVAFLDSKRLVAHFSGLPVFQEDITPPLDQKR